jgi:hypothetical protein
LLTAGVVQLLFLYLAFFGPIICGASGNGVLAPVGIPTTEGTAQITATCVPRMGEKQYVAMPALRQAFSQVGIFFENGSDNPVILRNNTADLFLAVPVTNKLKTGLYLYYKKAKCSLMSLMYLGIPSLFLFFLCR